MLKEKAPACEPEEKVKPELAMTNDLRIDSTLKENGSSQSAYYDVKLEFEHEANDVDKDKKIRFYVSFLCLLSLAIANMSRSVMNVSIVDMIQESDNTEMKNSGCICDTSPIEQPTTQVGVDDHPEVDHDEIHNPVKLQQLVIMSVYFGSLPMQVVGGNLADKHGSRILILGALLMTASINMLTPLLVRYSWSCLIFSRFMLGISQGCLGPAAYDLSNRWLTSTEMMIFAPTIKVAYGLGAVMGALMPGLAQLLGLNWTVAFYASGFIALFTATIWFIVATSNPDTNRLITSAEMERIKRKKVASSTPTSKLATPWFQIITCPSVIALMIVKVTCNSALEMYSLELAIYLREIHDAPIRAISIIAGLVSFIHVVFITPIGWAAKVLVQREAFGLGKTAWRKIFQGASNFSMAVGYLLMPIVAQNNVLLGSAFTLIIVTWMFSVGGESLIPFDLSIRYPATIYGLSSMMASCSGIIVPSLASWILQDSAYDPERWNTLFRIIGSASAFGGLVFVLLLKAEPFLPGERTTPAIDSAKKVKDVVGSSSDKINLDTIRDLA